MVCPYCGNQVPKNSLFCDNCGSRLAQAPQDAPPAYKSPAADPPVAPHSWPSGYSAPPAPTAPQKKRRWLLPLIIGLAVLAVAAAGFTLWFFSDARAYGQAQSLFEKGNYALAQTQFEALGGYSDSAEQVKACRYQQARQAFDRGDAEAAAEIFEALGDYQDSADWLLKCRPGLAGTWELTAMKSGGEDYTEMLQASGVKVILQLNEDGSGYIDFGGDKEDLTWDKDGITSDGVKIPYTTDGKTLTISEGGEEMTFTRK